MWSCNPSTPPLSWSWLLTNTEECEADAHQHNPFQWVDYLPTRWPSTQSVSRSWLLTNEEVCEADAHQHHLFKVMRYTVQDHEHQYKCYYHMEQEADTNHDLAHNKPCWNEMVNVTNMTKIWVISWYKYTLHHVSDLSEHLIVLKIILYV